jgi:hypothetical protein
MITAHDCPSRHHRLISRSCLVTHAAAWAARRGYRATVTDALIDEWTRSKNGVISGPTLTVHQGRHGAHGEWPVLGSYRRLLAALRLREAGVTEVRELRLLLWVAGYGGDEERLVRDLTFACAKMASRARREMALEPEGRARPRTPLRIRRQVGRAAAGLDLASIPGLTPDQWQLLRTALEDPHTVDLGAAVVDRMFRGSHPAVLDGLRSAAAGMPAGLPGPTEIVDATSIGAAALAPDDGSNLLLRDLQRARPADMGRAAAMLSSMPQILRWLRRTDRDEGAAVPGATLVGELCSMALAVWSSIPPSARIIILAMLTAESVRHPASSFWSAPEAALAS